VHLQRTGFLKAGCAQPQLNSTHSKASRPQVKLKTILRGSGTIRPSREMETLEQLRRKLLSLCIGTKLEEEGVHTVTFQPLLSRINEDRMATKSWDINGQRWLFLAVCDGEFQSHASQKRQN
jgi:hypothetical protein